MESDAALTLPGSFTALLIRRVGNDLKLASAVRLATQDYTLSDAYGQLAFCPRQIRSQDLVGGRRMGDVVGRCEKTGMRFRPWSRVFRRSPTDRFTCQTSAEAAVGELDTSGHTLFQLNSGFRPTQLLAAAVELGRPDLLSERLMSAI